MKPLHIAKVLAMIVSSTGMLVMIGWFLDIPALKSISPNWVTMKFTTALTFMLSGFTVYFVGLWEEGEQEVAQITLPITAGLVLLLMATLLASSLLGIGTGLENLFVREAVDAVGTVVPGRPSVGTMVCFILVAAAGAATWLFPRHQAWNRYVGWGVGSLGGLALVGYAAGVPALYYLVEGFSTAMAVHTAILFILLGLALVLASSPRGAVKP